LIALIPASFTVFTKLRPGLESSGKNSFEFSGPHLIAFSQKLQLIENVAGNVICYIHLTRNSVATVIKEVVLKASLFTNRIPVL